jgi:putative membrane protein
MPLGCAMFFWSSEGMMRSELEGDSSRASSQFDAEGSGWIGLDPRTLIVATLQSAVQAVFPLLFVIFFTAGLAGVLLIPLVALPFFAEVLRYAFFGYRLEPEEIVVREGVLQRTVRHIPYARIQNLATSEGLVQRLLGVVQVSVETAGGKEPEARFRWISRARHEEIHQWIQDARVGTASGRSTSQATRETDDSGASTIEPRIAAPSSATLEGERVLYRASLKDLLLLGLFSGRGLVIFGALAWLMSQFDVWEFSPLQRWVEARVRNLEIDSIDPTGALFTIAAVIAAMFALVVALSVALTAAAYFGFTLSSDATSLHTESGLFTRQTSTIRRRRIQILQIVSSPLLRWLGRAQLRAGTAGSRDERSARAAWLAPVGTECALIDLVKEVQPDASLEDLIWQLPHPLAARRLRWNALFGCAVLIAVSVWVFGPKGWIAMVVVPIAWVRAGQAVRYHGHATTDTAVFARRGRLWRRLEIVRYEKIQSVRVVESPLDRRWGMATLQVDTASSAGRLVVPLLARAEAAILQRALSLRAGRSGFRW